MWFEAVVSRERAGGAKAFLIGFAQKGNQGVNGQDPESVRLRRDV
jgi:hypothetical protein